MKDKLSPIDRMYAEGWKNLIIGIIASEMGYANVSNVVNSGEAVFNSLSKLTCKQLRHIKILLNETS